MGMLIGVNGPKMYVVYVLAMTQSCFELRTYLRDRIIVVSYHSSKSSKEVDYCRNVLTFLSWR